LFLVRLTAHTACVLVGRPSPCRMKPLRPWQLRLGHHLLLASYHRPLKKLLLVTLVVPLQLPLPGRAPRHDEQPACVQVLWSSCVLCCADKTPAVGAC
jgi:hypothetical protein